MKNLFVSLTILFSSFSATIAAEIPFNSFSGKSLNILIKLDMNHLLRNMKVILKM